ncbi:Bacteriophage CI repressor helix-turn-helix domain-containing protein [Muriicola jejuensis]|uniref:Helix-turn-helix domain-containing protein n=1 Tax=Muriicola jejuensis TaxID=504488 RepID=A0A6P0UD71_9FLAO|nr:helix-turn-helix transcriptional regulator [Muriicola jejuensis]NER11205.1 helix-turn-helix domain-containing protein [Muriicola jejuensis]SMP24242.1 Bacteriophage CI repressor helix-turn-helix domain-containing protein [Muriicola jejuensis]
MVNTGEFIARLEKILEYYNVSASVFADKIGVQRSSISHVLTGRNKPSLEFVMKVVRSYPDVNLYWLLNGKGEFPSRNPNTAPVSMEEAMDASKAGKGKKIKRVLILYEDGSFEAFE